MMISHPLICACDRADIWEVLAEAAGYPRGEKVCLKWLASLLSRLSQLLPAAP